MDITNTISSPYHCEDEDFRLHLFGHAVFSFLRGCASALLMPLEVLDALRCGRHIDRLTGRSWLLSAALYAGFFAVSTFSRQALPGGQNHAIAFLCCCLGVVAIGIWNGKLQPGEGVRKELIFHPVTACEHRRMDFRHHLHMCHRHRGYFH
jgi:hypothetical protein